MPGHAKDSGPGNAEAGNQGLESAGQPETDQDQLAVHTKEGQEGVQVRLTRPQSLSRDPRSEAPEPAHSSKGWARCASKPPRRDTNRVHESLAVQIGALGNG